MFEYQGFSGLVSQQLSSSTQHPCFPTQMFWASSCWFRRAQLLRGPSTAWSSPRHLRALRPSGLKTSGASLQLPRPGGRALTPSAVIYKVQPCFAESRWLGWGVGQACVHVCARARARPRPLPSQTLPRFPSALSHLLCAKLQHSQRSPTAATNPVLGSRSAVEGLQLV